MTAGVPPEGVGRAIGQRGTTEFLVRTGDNTARIVDVATGSVSTVPDLKSELASGGWEQLSDPAGADKAVFLVKASEARWQKTTGGLSGIDFGGGKEDGQGD